MSLNDNLDWWVKLVVLSCMKGEIQSIMMTSHGQTEHRADLYWLHSLSDGVQENFITLFKCDSGWCSDSLLLTAVFTENISLLPHVIMFYQHICLHLKAQGHYLISKTLPYGYIK